MIGHTNLNLKSLKILIKIPWPNLSALKICKASHQFIEFCNLSTGCGKTLAKS